ncbi:MAG: hypothetical protein ACYCUM_03570 [Solirubrobacteraceae bacterium]
MPDGGRFTILAKRRPVDATKTEYQLFMYGEEPAKQSTKPRGRGEHEMVSGGGASGPWVGRNPVQAGMLLVLEELHKCSGTYPYALVFGMLRAPRDSVTARTRATTVRFKKVKLPASLHADGALVYALLPPGNTEVVTRAPGGQVRTTEYAHGRNDRMHCGGPPTHLK